MFGETDRVEGVTGRAEHGAELRCAPLERLHVVRAMVEDHPGERVVDPVVHVVAEFVVAERLADDLRDGGGGGRDEKPPRLGEDLDRCREQPVDLVVDLPRQVGELRHGVVVVGRESTADVEQFQREPAARRLGEHAGAKMQRLDVVFRIGALAADVEAQALDDQTGIVGVFDQLHRLSRQGPEFARQFHHRAGVGHAQAQRQTGVRGVLGDLLHLLVVVVGNQRLVAVEFAKRLDRLDRIGVDDLVPDEVLPLLGWQFGDQPVDGVKLLHAGDVETATQLVECLDDRRVAVDLHRVVHLHAGEVAAEELVFAAQFVVIDDEQGGAMLAGEGQQFRPVHREVGASVGRPGGARSAWSHRARERAAVNPGSIAAPGGRLRRRPTAPGAAAATPRRTVRERP